jgi:hypothetical protein
VTTDVRALCRQCSGARRYATQAVSRLVGVRVEYFVLGEHGSRGEHAGGEGGGRGDSAQRERGAEERLAEERASL